jgi:hypothetical protein
MNTRKKLFHIATAAALAAIAAATPVAGEPALKELPTPESKMPTPLEAAQIKAALAANQFRLALASDVEAAVSKYGSAAFRAQWAEKITAVFPGNESLQIRDFFSSAVVWLGAVDEKFAIVANYNPWADGLFIFSMALDAEHPVVTEFAVASGINLRGGQADGSIDLSGLYSLQEPVIIALSRLYSSSLAAFEAAFQGGSPAAPLPPALAAKLEAQNIEILYVKTFLAVRTQMFVNLISDANKPWFASCGALLGVLRKGDAAAVKTALSSKQDPAVVENFMMLPQFIRGKLSPNFFVAAKDGKGAIAAFVNPDSPRWVISAIFAGSADEKRIARFEILDLELGAKAVGIWDKGDAQ